jgi:hypothetical protein
MMCSRPSARAGRERRRVEALRGSPCARAGEREMGTTPRFVPIAPFMLTVLITGARFG